MSSRAYIPASKSIEWGTPPKLFNEISAELGPFDLDVAASDELHLCERYYTREFDGLVQPWTGRVWCNPPYGRGIGQWLKRGADAAESGEAEIVVMLVPAATSAVWWHDHVLGRDAEVRYIRGRLRFVGATSGAPFASALVIYRGKGS